MKRCSVIPVVIFCCLFIMSCAPVLRKDIMNAGIRDVPLSEVKKNPDTYMGKLFIFGGIIVDTKGTAEGSLIEAIYVPVDSKGKLRSVGTLQTRFLALFPKKDGLLDPMIFSRDRKITLAGEFAGIREGKIDEMPYGFPYFIIKELYLWKQREYYPYHYYYEPYPYYWWSYPGWGPWWRPYWW